MTAARQDAAPAGAAETGAEAGFGAWAGRLRDPALLLGLALAAAAIAPLDAHSVRGGSPTSAVIFSMVALAVTLWGAPAVVARPEVAAIWTAAVARHRNTLFPAACVALAALDRPAGWLAAVIAALLLAYLVTVDLRAAGPVGLRQARSPVILPAAVLCTGVTMAAALAPVGADATWARLAAALAVVCAGVLVGAALWTRRAAARAAVLGPGAGPDRQPEGSGRRH